MATLRAAVIGAGHLGKYHAQKYDLIPGVTLNYVVDVDPEPAIKVAKLHNTTALTNYKTILDKVDLVSIAVPTHYHHSVATDFLKAGVHVLVEKPISTTARQAQGLIDLAKQNNCLLQVGHSERFHPGLQLVRNELGNPLYIESHRLAPFQLRGLDINVVLDLMIHDIDIILNIVDSSLRLIQPIGIPVVTPELDIANVRLEFDNGCVANVTASRVSGEPLRKMRFFDYNKYISVDFNTHTIVIKHCTSATGQPEKLEILEQTQQYSSSDVILAEIQAFIDSIRNGTPVQVTGEQALRALEVAITIGTKLQIKNKFKPNTGCYPDNL